MATSTDFVNALNKHLQSRDQRGSYTPAENASYWGTANQLLSGITDPEARRMLENQVKNYQTQSEQLTSSAQAMIRNAGDMTADRWANMSSGDQQKYAKARGLPTTAITDGLAFKGDVNEGVFNQMTPETQYGFLQRYIQSQKNPAVKPGGPSLGFWGEGGDNPISQAFGSIGSTFQDAGGTISGGRWIPKSELGMDSGTFSGIADDPWGSIRVPMGTTIGGVLGTTAGSVLGIPGMVVGGITGGKLGNKATGGSGGGSDGVTDGITGNGKSGSTMGDDIPMPTLPGYKSPFEGLQTNTYAPSAIPYSAWKDMALNKQAAEESKMMSDAAAQSAGGLANARSQLAMRGGLRGGAAERLARGGASDLLGARQNVMSQGVINRANIGMQGAQMDTDVNKFNAGLGAEAQKFNISNALQDVANQNEWEKFKYGEQMKLKGAGMTGQAIKNAGKK